MSYPADQSDLPADFEDTDTMATAHAARHNDEAGQVNAIERYGPVLTLATLADSSPVTNVAAETALDVVLALPTDALNVEEATLRLRATGLYTSSASVGTNTLHLRMHINGVLVAHMSRDMGSGHVDLPWLLETEAVVRHAGNHGILACESSLLGTSSDNFDTGDFILADLNLTGALVIDVSSEWSAGDVLQSVKGRTLSAQIYYPAPVQPPPPPPPPDPDTTFEGLPQIEVAPFGANKAAIDAALAAYSSAHGSAEGWIHFAAGSYTDQAPRVWPSNIHVRGDGRSLTTIARHTSGSRQGVFWSIKKRSGGFTVDAANVPGPWTLMPTELECGAPLVELYDFAVINYLGMAVSVGDDDCYIHDYVLRGNGSTGCTNAEDGEATWGGIWSGNGAKRLRVHDGDARNIGGGSIFCDIDQAEILRVTSIDNCLGFTRDINDPDIIYGGGQVVTGVNARDVRIQWCPAWSAGDWASGYEINGERVKILDADQIKDHVLNTGVVFQQGTGHEIAGCDVTGNRVGMYVDSSVGFYKISQQERIRDNLESNLIDNGHDRLP